MSSISARRLLWISFWTLFAPTAALANAPSELRFVRTVNSTSSEFLIAYPEGDRWMLDYIREESGGLPDLVSRRTFRDRNAVLHSAKARLFLQGFRPAMLPSAVGAKSASAAVHVTEAPGQALWPVTQSWSWEWELRYAEWISQNVDEDFFKKHGIATDCADVAVAARWIFARIHGLPAGFRLSGSGKLFTHESLKRSWLRLPSAQKWTKDRRFLASLDYVMIMTYTHSLMRDSYPVAISAESILAGVHHLELSGQSGHTLLVQKTDYSDTAISPIETLSSTVPRVVRGLSRQGYWDVSARERGKSGFMRVRWLEKRRSRWILKDPVAHPTHSLEQYSPDFVQEGRSFAEAVLLKINPTFDFRARLQGGLRDLKEQIRQRAGVVVEGWKLCSVQNCNEGTANHENWSTPSRDKRLGELIDQLKGIVERLKYLEGLQQIWAEASTETVLELDSGSYSLGEVIHSWQYGLYSSEPSDSPEYRWATSAESAVGALTQVLDRDLIVRDRTVRTSSAATYEPDDRLRKALSYVQAYCDAAPEERCNRFRTSLRTSVTANGKTASDLLSLLPWLGSDPSLPLDHRLGTHRTSYQPKMLEGYPRVSIDGLSLTDDGRLIALRTGEVIPPPEGFLWAALDPGSSRAAAVLISAAEWKIRVFSSDASGASWASGRKLLSEVTLPAGEHEATTQLAWVSSRFLVAFDGPCQQVLDIGADGSKAKVERFCFLSLSSVPGIWLGRKKSDSPDGQIYSMSDLRGETAIHHDITWPAFENLEVRPTSAYLVLGDYLLGASLLCTNEDCTSMESGPTFAIQTRTGEVRYPWSPHTYLYPLGKGPKVMVTDLSNGRVELAELDEELRLRKRTEIGRRVIVIPEASGPDQYILIASGTGSVDRYLRLRGDDLEEARLLEDETRMVAASGGRVILELRSGGLRVRRFGDRRAEYEIDSGELAFWPGSVGHDRSRWISVKGSSAGARMQVFDLNQPEWPVFDGIDHDTPEVRADSSGGEMLFELSMFLNFTELRSGSALRFGSKGPWLWLPPASTETPGSRPSLAH